MMLVRKALEIWLKKNYDAGTGIKLQGRLFDMHSSDQIQVIMLAQQALHWSRLSPQTLEPCFETQ